jgi:hypothetical protein
LAFVLGLAPHPKRTPKHHCFGYYRNASWNLKRNVKFQRIEKLNKETPKIKIVSTESCISTWIE